MISRQLILSGLILLCACESTMPADLSTTPGQIWALEETPALIDEGGTPTLSYILPVKKNPGDPYFTPTPDDPHFDRILPGEDRYIVQMGDNLSSIAERFHVLMEAIVEANQLTNPDSLEIGQQLIIPAIITHPVGPDNKLIPDSELVFGPLATSTDIEAVINRFEGYLAHYTENVHGTILSGAEIVVQIASAYSINPRLLIAILEYESGWLTSLNPRDKDNPFGYLDEWYAGLYRQLAWAAIQLNDGYYRWRRGGLADLILVDGTVVPMASTINAGTAGIQHFFSRLDNYESWLIDVSPGGLFDVYFLLFGNPFNYAIEPLIPSILIQPDLQLPFQVGEIWSFTGGPHLAWDVGTPFAAIDFAPPGEALGCVQVNDWVTAIADGRVIRTGEGVVIYDLDLDGNEGTGWVILYMHVESRDRVQAGAFLQAGDPIGHPSCEGGLSSGTHVHLARKFNGEWIPADGSIPFNLDGWVSSGSGEEYVGALTRGDQTVIAFEGNSTENLIHR